MWKAIKFVLQAAAVAFSFMLFYFVAVTLLFLYPKESFPVEAWIVTSLLLTLGYCLLSWGRIGKERD